MKTGQQVQVPGYLRLSKIIAYIMYVWVIIGVVSLTLRVLLLLLSANPAAGFVDFVYRISADYLGPFRGIFPSRPVGETGYLDVAAVFAIVVYLFVLWGFSSLVNYVQFKIDQSTHEQEKEIERMRQEKLARVNEQPVRQNQKAK